MRAASQQGFDPSAPSHWATAGAYALLLFAASYCAAAALAYALRREDFGGKAVPSLAPKPGQLAALPPWRRWLLRRQQRLLDWANATEPLLILSWVCLPLVAYPVVHLLHASATRGADSALVFQVMTALGAAFIMGGVERRCGPTPGTAAAARPLRRLGAPKQLGAGRERGGAAAAAGSLGRCCLCQCHPAVRGPAPKTPPWHPDCIALARQGSSSPAELTEPLIVPAPCLCLVPPTPARRSLAVVLFKQLTAALAVLDDLLPGHVAARMLEKASARSTTSGLQYSECLQLLSITVEKLVRARGSGRCMPADRGWPFLSY
jgi:hypothetical protein